MMCDKFGTKKNQLQRKASGLEQLEKVQLKPCI